MCILRVHAQCFDRFLEVLPDERENAELAVEDVMSHVLLRLFGEGIVDDVSIHFASAGNIGTRSCSIQIYTQYPCQCFAFQPRTKEHIRVLVKESLGLLLKELFGAVQIDSVALSPSFWDCEQTPELQCVCA